MQPSKGLWEQLHIFLHGRDAARFPLPADGYDSQSFSALFSSELPPVHLILDEAFALADMPEAAIASFLETLRTLRDYRSETTRRGSLASMILLGVEGLASIVNHRSWTSSNAKSPFTMVSINVFAPRLEKSNQLCFHFCPHGSDIVSVGHCGAMDVLRA